MEILEEEKRLGEDKKLEEDTNLIRIRTLEENIHMELLKSSRIIAIRSSTYSPECNEFVCGEKTSKFSGRVFGC